MGGDVAGSGIPHAEILVEFAEAAVGANPARLDAARSAVLQAMGGEALCDTAAVAALFNAIDRVADSTGIPLEEEKAELSAGMRDQLGINQFGVIAEEVAAAE
jgi:hypothetical protein